MERKFNITCESTADMPFSYMKRRGADVLFYTYTIDGVEYEDDMQRTVNGFADFYKRISEGSCAKTSQINTHKYEEFFESKLKDGDLLHIAFGSGMSRSVQNAFAAAESLKQKYPDRKITVIDSLCSSSGYGMLIDIALDMADKGRDIDEVSERILSLRERIHHQFFSTDMSFFRKSGRVSGPTAAIATVLGICPIMRLNRKGEIISYTKVRGKAAAIEKTLGEMKAHADGGENYTGKCFLCHSNSPELAAKTLSELRKTFPKLPEIKIFDIGNIVASHCGSGTVAVFFVGDRRPK